LAHGLRGFSHGPWLIVAGSMVTEYIMVEGCSGAKPLASWWPGSRDRKRKRPGPRDPLQKHAPSNLLSPTRSHLLPPPNNAIKL
jgi:hypothetical protein